MWFTCRFFCVIINLSINLLLFVKNFLKKYKKSVTTKPKSSNNFECWKRAWPKDHRVVKIFALVKVIKGKAQRCFAVARLYRSHVVNIQKIQNGNSEFFVNSPCDFKCWQGILWLLRSRYVKICLQRQSYKLYTVYLPNAFCQDMYRRVRYRGCFAELQSSLGREFFAVMRSHAW